MDKILNSDFIKNHNVFQIMAESDFPTPKLIVMCGLQCSGKSTKANELAKEYDAEVISSDNIRKEYPEAKNDFIFKTLYERVNKLLHKCYNVIIDATNITIKSRRQIFLNIHEKCEKICYIMNTQYNECVKRLQLRNLDINSHHVPEEVLENYYKSFEIPFYEEGWNDIIICNIPNKEISDNVFEDIIKAADGFNQQNKHHTQDLGLHMKTVGDKLKSQGIVGAMLKAAYYHDTGKLMTQTIDENGQAHYYNHANIGAYGLMCCCGTFNTYCSIDEIKYVYDTKFTLEWLFYINYHMHMFNIKTDKSIKKWKSIFGEDKFNNLKIFNNADKARDDVINN